MPPLLALAALSALAAPPEPDPQLTVTDVFRAGRGGYASYRIPGVIVTPKGTVIVYCEARKNSAADWGTIDVVARRSEDRGATWGPPVKLVEPDPTWTPNPVTGNRKDPGVTVNNPVMIPDPATGAVHFLFCVEYARCFYARSDDDGKTFATPVEVTPTFEAFRTRAEYDWKVIATGPGHGVRLRSGRLLVPVWLSTSTKGPHKPSAVATVYSDDAGKTWKPGDLIAGETGVLTDPNETAVAELSDGRVIAALRHVSPTKQRAFAVSPDGVGNWSEPRFEPAIPDPVCMAGLCSFPGGLAFSNPGTAKGRQQLTVRLSPDGGATWPAARVLELGPSAYSDLAAGPDGALFCAFERGFGATGTPYQMISVARFAPTWVAAGK